MSDGKFYSREDMANAFKIAQHSDFSPTQIQRMIDQADRDGSSRDYGDGYMIYRVGQNLYRGTVAGKAVSVTLEPYRGHLG